MQSKLFEILNLDTNATENEVLEAYTLLKNKLRDDMFCEGEVGNNAAEKLTYLESLYSQYQDEIAVSVKQTESEAEEVISPAFQNIHNLVKNGDPNSAQTALDNIMDRNAEWHYYQSMIYYKKDWYTDSLKHLKTAISMEPDNAKYKTALERLNKIMFGDETKAKPVNADDWWKTNENEHNPNGTGGWSENDRQMGGCDSSLNCCTQLLCMNLLCNCCGGGC